MWKIKIIFIFIVATGFCFALYMKDPGGASQKLRFCFAVQYVELRCGFAGTGMASQELRPLAAGEKLSARETVINIWRKTALQGLTAKNQTLRDLINSNPRNGLLVRERNRGIIPHLGKPAFFADWRNIAQDIKTKGIDISMYKEAYGELAIYFFLRDIDEAGYRISARQIINRNPVNRSPYTSYEKLNTAFGQPIFKQGLIPVNRFFIALSELSAQPQNYQGVEGMLKLAKWLQTQGHETNLLQFYSTFGGTRASAVVKALTTQTLPDDFNLNWECIDMPYKRLVDTAKELAKDHENYKNVEGMLKLAKWLEIRGQGTHLGHLHSAFGGVKAKAVVKILTGKELPDDFNLNWEYINMPYKRLVDTAKELAKNTENYKNVEGMLRLAKWLETRGQETHLGHLYFVFGRDRARAVVKTLTGQELPEGFNLNWESIDMPYKIAIQLLREAVKEEYSDIDGLDRLVKDFIAVNPAIDEHSIISLVVPRAALYERLAIVTGQALSSSAGPASVSKRTMQQLETGI